MIQEFYYGSSWRWPLPYIPRVMLSYNMLRSVKKTWEINIPFMMDSGAFAVIRRYKDYPYSCEEYAEGIKKWHPDIAWTMDYPCEPELRKIGKYTVREAQNKTINNSIRLLDLRVNTQMVVQGWEINDYLENLDLIKERGLLTSHLGIGSICRRGKTQEIARIIRTVRRNVPGWVRLHGFGIKTVILRDTDAKVYLHSADSQSWDYESRYGDWVKGKYVSRNWHDKVPYLLKYVNRMESYLKINQSFLEVENENAI